MKESKIIRGIEKGDHKVLRYLYDEYGGLFFGMAQRYLMEVSEAEDAVQETFIKIHKHIKSFEKKGSFEGWMKRILVNTCLNKVRYISKNDSINEVNGDHREIKASDEDIIAKLNAEEIVEAMQKLPPGYRTVLNLYVLEGYSHKEIGEMLGIQESASRSQLLKARNRLRRELMKCGILSSERVA